MKQAQHQEDVLRSSSAGLMLAGLAGIYFIMGAIYSFALGRWFPGFPTQLDALSSLLGGGTAGVYTAGVVAMLLGVVCIGRVVLASRRMRSNTSLERTRER